MSSFTCPGIDSEAKDVNVRLEAEGFLLLPSKLILNRSASKASSVLLLGVHFYPAVSSDGQTDRQIEIISSQSHLHGRANNVYYGGKPH